VRSSIVCGVDGVHDMGGMAGFGTVRGPGVDEVFHEVWERRVFALQLLTGYLGLRAGNGRAIREEMDPVAYLAASYYERWLYSAEQGLLAKGTVTTDELASWQARVAAGEPVPTRDDPADRQRARRFLAEEPGLVPAPQPRFSQGDRVRVRRMRPPQHSRCPRYVRGVVGVVTAVRGADAPPLDDGPPEPVYAVSFSSVDVFGDSDEPAWTIILDLWERYVEPTSA
jgi:nitrile hydratase subunit beta